MSRQTHPPPSSGGSPFRLPARGDRRGYSLHGDPTRGAAPSAPTAPHATSPAAKPKRLSGPARFWDGRAARIAATVTFVLSIAVHWVIAPWELFPSSSGLELKDPNGDLAIPVDLLGQETPPPEPEPPPPPAPPEPTPKEQDPNAFTKLDAGPRRRDAAADAQPLAALPDAGVVPESDGGAISDAGEGDGAIDDGGLVALADGGTPGSNGPRDPESMFGLTKVVNAGVQNVVLGVNVALIRKHPVGARMGPILQAIPQWRDFLKGAPTPVDPIRDTDWILIYGPSLIHTDKDAVLVRTNLPDSALDATIGAIASTYDKGGAFDAGVPGVKASLGYADNGQRVFLRPQSKLLVIVPPSHAREAALTFKKQSPRGPAATEALRLILHDPMNQVRGLNIPSLTEIRLWILPQKDGSADVYAEGDCADEAGAAEAAARVKDIISRQNAGLVRLATHGLLNNVEIAPDGRRVKLHLTATEDQLEAVLSVVAARFNVDIPPRPGASAP